ncbi:MAG: hypothetical protein ACRDBX_01680, partial [Erysipelotrichaceae bacterium]
MNTITWLLEQDAYVQYAVRKHLLHEKEETLFALRANVLQDPRVQAYLDDVAHFNKTLVTTHKNPDLPIHKLHFLLDIGLDERVPQIAQAIQQIQENRDEFGMPQSPTNVPTHYGGSGVDTMGWALCDAPWMLYALARCNVDFETIKPGVDYLLFLERDNGFPCAVSKELGTFRGPGKKSDCCPYATFCSLKLFSALPDYVDKATIVRSVDVLLSLWEQSREQHPYMFFMGTDFRKVKAPLIWYDLVSLLDCLSMFEEAKKDARFQEMLDVLVAKADDKGRYTPESIYLKSQM